MNPFSCRTYCVYVFELARKQVLGFILLAVGLFMALGGTGYLSLDFGGAYRDTKYSTSWSKPSNKPRLYTFNLKAVDEAGNTIRNTYYAYVGPEITGKWEISSDQTT